MEPKAPEAPQYDKTVVGYVEKPGLEAIAQAEKLAAATEYTPAYKHEAISKFMPDAAEATRLAAKEEREKLAKEIESLKPKTRHQQVLPASMDAARVQAVKDALHALAASASSGEMYTLWENSLEHPGDKETAWVFLYHGPVLLRRTMRREEYPGVTLDGVVRRQTPRDDAKLPLGSRYDRLKERTDEFLATPEQRAARVKLNEADATLKRINGAENVMLSRMTGWRIDRDGFVDGMTAGMRAQLRAHF